MLGFMTTNVKIMKSNESSGIYKANCFSLPVCDNDVHCTVEGENQNKLDLVYITNTNKFNATISYSIFQNNISTNKNAKLTFLKVYEFFNYSSGLKISVGDDEDLPDGATLFYKLGNRLTFTYQPASQFNPCEYYDHILSCRFNSLGTQYMYKLYTMESKEGIIWTNLKDQYIDIPRNMTFTFY